jgi:hypothetical protein
MSLIAIFDSVSFISIIQEGQEHDPAKRPSGYRHMLKHEHEFPDHIRGLDLLELAEAATQVGTRAGNQGAKKNRAGTYGLL